MPVQLDRGGDTGRAGADDDHVDGRGGVEGGLGHAVEATGHRRSDHSGRLRSEPSAARLVRCRHDRPLGGRSWIPGGTTSMNRLCEGRVRHRHRRRSRHRPRVRADAGAPRREGRRQRPRRRPVTARAATRARPIRWWPRSSPRAARPSRTRENVADFDGAERMVQQAVDTFGDLHAVINNAGILRDRMLANMTRPSGTPSSTCT